MVAAERLSGKAPLLYATQHPSSTGTNIMTAPPQMQSNKVCAVVVTFFPDSGFEERIQVLLPQVETLVVVDNTPVENCAPHLAIRKENDSRIHIIENHENLGIAAALNQGLNFALESGHKWILTLDQDTQCYPDMVTTLLQVNEACEPKPAVIGSNYYDIQNSRLKVPACKNGEYLEQKTVITSGSLVDASMARTIGGFRDDYFIDQLDHEFCLRVRSCGGSVVISRKPVMAHSVGESGGARLPWLGIMPNHPPLRKYYIARNTVVTLAQYWRREPGWCLRRLVRLLLGLALLATLEKHRLAKIRAFAEGVADGVRLRMGACERAWLCRP